MMDEAQSAASTSDVADRAELIGLVSRYAAAIDARDIDGIVACFTDDARLELEGGAEMAEGPAALAELFTRAFQSPLLGSSGTSTHLMANVIVTLDGDRAHVEAQGVAHLASRERTTVVVRGLRYTDDCVRERDRWLFRKRVHRALWQAELPGGPL
jgi:ketosteroid isomerase-like protein